MSMSGAFVEECVKSVAARGYPLRCDEDLFFLSCAKPLKQKKLLTLLDLLRALHPAEGIHATLAQFIS